MMVDLSTETRKLAYPNPKYNQAVRIAKQFKLQWVSVVEDFGTWERRFEVRNGEKVYQYKVQFTEEQLEFSKIPEEMVRHEIAKAVKELSRFSGFSRSELHSRFASGLVA